MGREEPRHQPLPAPPNPFITEDRPLEHPDAARNTRAIMEWISQNSAQNSVVRWDSLYPLLDARKALLLAAGHIRDPAPNSRPTPEHMAILVVLGVYKQINGFRLACDGRGAYLNWPTQPGGSPSRSMAAHYMFPDIPVYFEDNQWPGGKNSWKPVA